MPPFVDVLVDGEGSFAVRHLGDDNLRSAFGQLGDDPVGVERLVGDQAAELNVLDQRRHADRVVALAWQKDKPDEVAQAHQSAPGFWSSGRRETCRWPGFESPFCALTMAMDPNDGGINHRVFHVGLVGDRVEHALEHIRLHPVAEALEHRVPVAKQRRQITPGTAGSCDPQDRLHEQSAVTAGRCRSGCGGNRGGVISEWFNNSQPALARRGRLRHGKE